jgi:hypothetical protein
VVLGVVAGDRPLCTVLRPHPFAFDGRLGGFLTRLSHEEITNVHATGSLTASFAIEPRPN